MNCRDMLIKLKKNGFHMSIVSIETEIPYMRLNKCINGGLEMKETEYIKILRYLDQKKHILSEG